MAPIPDTALLRTRMVELDGAISREWGRIAIVIKDNPHLNQQQLIGEHTRVYNLMTRRHMLEMMRTYPTVEVLWEVTFVSLMDADGKEVSIPRRLKGRRADGALKGDYLRLVEVKTVTDLTESFPKGKAKVFNEFLPSSHIGGEILNERALLEWGPTRGTSFHFEYTNPLTLHKGSITVPVGDIGVSMPMTYKNMGDGIESSTLFRPKPKPGGSGPQGSGAGPKTVAGETPKTEPKTEPSHSKTSVAAPNQEPPTRKAVEHRGTTNRATEDRGKPVERQAGIPGAEPRGRSEPYDIGRLASPTDPRGLFEQGHNTLGAIEGGAMMLYERQVERLYASAWSQAEKTFERNEKMHNALFAARQGGMHVLVQFNMIETDAPNASGDLLRQFWNVTYKSAVLPGVTATDFKTPQEYQSYVVERLHAARMPASLSAAAETDDSRHVPAGWHLTALDYMVQQPFDASPPTKTAVPDARDIFTIRGTVGRCTR